MGQLTVGMSHLTVLAVIGVLMNMVLVNGQDCNFNTDEIDKTGEVWKVTAKQISEKVSPDGVIWNVPTQNVASSTAASHSHNKYLTGLRYASRYEYRAGSSFQNFVNSENTTRINRLVTYECADSEKIQVFFEFPLIDINDPPSFITTPQAAIEVKLNEMKENPEKVINEGIAILAEDKDFNPDYNGLEFSSDRPSLLRTQRKLEGSFGMGQRFSVNLRLTSTNVTLGRYSVNLFCTDKEYTASTTLTINIS